MPIKIISINGHTGWGAYWSLVAQTDYGEILVDHKTIFPLSYERAFEILQKKLYDYVHQLSQLDKLKREYNQDAY